jgi:hypothetical protein
VHCRKLTFGSAAPLTMPHRVQRATGKALIQRAASDGIMRRVDQSPASVLGVAIAAKAELIAAE